MGSEHPSIMSYGNAFDDKDAEHLFLAVGSDSQCSALCDVLGCPELAADVGTNVARCVARSEVLRVVFERIRTWSRPELLQKLSECNVHVAMRSRGHGDSV